MYVCMYVRMQQQKPSRTTFFGARLGLRVHSSHLAALSGVLRDAKALKNVAATHLDARRRLDVMGTKQSARCLHKRMDMCGTE